MVVFLFLSFLHCLTVETKIITLSDVVLNVLEEILEKIIFKKLLWIELCLLPPPIHVEALSQCGGI